MQAPDLPDARLRPVLLLTVLCGAGWLAALPALPGALRTPGSPVLYLAGVAGALLLGVPVAYALVKRGGAAASPPRWLAAHVLASCAGAVLAVVHSAGHLGRAPALLLLVLAAVLALGAVGRLHAARGLGALFASRPPRASAPDPRRRARLAAVLDEKRRLLGALDPDADEARFSPTLAHWRRRPALALAYARLAGAERRLLGGRRRAGALLAWWRPAHLLLGAVLVLGVLVHVVTVTFFAGYVADGGPIRWWHLAAWG